MEKDFEKLEERLKEKLEEVSQENQPLIQLEWQVLSAIEDFLEPIYYECPKLLSKNAQKEKEKIRKENKKKREKIYEKYVHKIEEERRDIRNHMYEDIKWR